MPNMSYCRFENTLHALNDCLAAIEEDGLDTLKSHYEREAAEALVFVAKRFLNAYKLAENDRSTAVETGITPDE